MKKASAKIRRKVKLKLYRELTSISQKFEFKSSSQHEDRRNVKRK